MVDIRFDSTTMDMLESMIGKSFEHYSCDPFIFTPNVFGIVGFRIGGENYKMTSGLEVVQRFFHDDDVAVMRIAPCQPGEIVSMMEDGQMIDTPVQDAIVSIDVVNDCESVAHDGERKDMLSTKGIIFHLASGNEISFEIGTWFSEMITIRRGYELIKQFTPLADFSEEWEDSEGYTPDCSREVISIR
ncbi:MAG: hypothetical protein IJ713_04825 [Oscillibacter sp.]|nr:hypothetical protein [Oscillibacter sp.]